jgi:hypothetical protein
MSNRHLFAPLVLPLAALLFAAQPALAQSETASTAKSQDPAVSSVPSPAPATADVTATPAKKVWTNENLSEAHGTVSVVGDKRNQKSLGTPSRSGGSTGASVRPDLQKLQAQLNEVNKQLAWYKAFQEGEPVSTNVRDFDKGISRVPVDQQMVKLKEKAVKLKQQIDELTDEARKKGVPSNQLP